MTLLDKFAIRGENKWKLATFVLAFLTIVASAFYITGMNPFLRGWKSRMNWEVIFSSHDSFNGDDRCSVDCAGRQ